MGQAFTRWQAAGALSLQMLALWTLAYLALVFSLRERPGSPRRS
jgi:hypothetical protein